MTHAADFPKRLPLTAWIVGRRDGRFDLLGEYEPGAVRADLVHVLEGEYLELVDAVAWECHRPGRWWTLRGVATVLGEHELAAAWWEQRPARMVATPADWLAQPLTSFVIVDWSTDINAAIGAAPGVVCDTPALACRLRRTLIEQAMPKLPITVLGHRRVVA